MRNRISARSFLAYTLSAVMVLAASSALVARQEHPLTVASAKVTVAGSSNIHEWSATTAEIRVTHAKLGASVSDPNFLDAIVKPGAFDAFEISIPVATLKSGKDGLDKNMYKALKSPQIANITFHATKMSAGIGAGMLRATGMLKIAGAEREVTIEIKAVVSGGTLSIKGSLPIVMTDYGIDPPKAMLGVLKTDPKVTVTFEAVLAVAPAATFHN